MEVRSEPGIMSNRDSFTISVQKSPTSSPTPVVQNIRMPYAGDGTSSVFRPASGGSASASYQVGSGEFSVAQSLPMNSAEPVKKKRGRPRKYAPGGKVPLHLSSPPASSPASTGFSLSYASTGLPRPLESSSALQVEEMKKAKGRLGGSAKKFNIEGLGSSGIGFTAHVITVKAGEDVSSKIMSFSHHGPRAVCVLSANGAISNVTLRQASSSGGTVTYEGRFEILSLSGSFLQSEISGQRSRTGGLSVSLAGPDGRVMGGGVAGLLTAASPIQVVVGSFIPDSARKEAQRLSDAGPGPGSLATGSIPAPSSPTSRGTLSESSGGGPGSPLNQSANGNNNNNNQQSLASMPWK